MKPERRKKSYFKSEKVEGSSGNVFADLGLPDAEELLVKSQLAVSIAELIERRGWNQTETARCIGIDQPKVSNLLRGKLSGFSADRLFVILNRLGHSVDVRISANQSASEKARTRVTIA